MSSIIPKFDLARMESQLDRHETIPVGLCEYSTTKWARTYITGYDFKWTSRRYSFGDMGPFGSTGFELDFDTYFYNPIENLVAGDCKEFCGVKSVGTLTFSGVAVEIIPKKQNKSNFFGDENIPMIETLKVEHDFYLKEMKPSLVNRAECFKRTEEWEKIERHFEEMEQRDRSKYLLLHGYDFGIHCPPPYPREHWDPEYDKSFSIDEKRFREFMRKVIPKVRLTISYLSRKLLDAIFEEEKRLFASFVNESAGVYGIAEQDIAQAIISAQNPPDFNVHVREEPESESILERIRRHF